MSNSTYQHERTEKMFTFLRGICSDGKHQNTTRALGFAREKHKDQTRKNGAPYLIHPLAIACDAVGLGLFQDEFLAMLILHDVPEDTGTLVMDLPVSDAVRRGVECMTLRRMPDESKLESKRRYYKNLAKPENFFPLLGKGLDRRDNLGTMASDMSHESQVKNIVETWYFLLPELKEAKQVSPEYSNQLHTIRRDLTMMVNTMAAYTKTELLPEMPSEDVLNGIFK